MTDKYRELKSKLDLPELDILKANFDVDGIDEEDNVLKEILKKILVKVDSYASLFENLLQPDSSIVYMHEASNLDSDNKILIKKLYMKLMHMERGLQLNTVDFEEQKASLAIAQATNDWLGLKEDLKLILGKLKDSWTKNSETTKQEGYFG